MAILLNVAENEEADANFKGEISGAKNVPQFFPLRADIISTGSADELHADNDKNARRQKDGYPEGDCRIGLWLSLIR